MSTILKRREIPTILAAICGLVIIIDYFFAHSSTTITALKNGVMDLSSIVTIYTLIVGGLVVVIYFGRKVVRREKEWWLGLYTIIIVILVLGMGVANYQTGFDWFVLWVEVPSHATLSAVALLFYMMASYRRFRIRNLEAFLLMIGGTCIALTNAPLWGGLLTPWIVPVGIWFRDVAFVAVQRAVVMMASIGAIIMALRTYIGAERAMIRQKEEGGGEE